MPLAEDQNMIQALAPKRSDQPFSIWILPGRPRRCWLVANPHRPKSTHSRVTRSTLHGLREEFHIEIGRGCRAREARNQPPTPAGKTYRRSLFVEPLAPPGGAEVGAVPSANTVSWPPSDV